PPAPPQAPSLSGSVQEMLGAGRRGCFPLGTAWRLTGQLSGHSGSPPPVTRRPQKAAHSARCSDRQFDVVIEPWAAAHHWRLARPSSRGRPFRPRRECAMPQPFHTLTAEEFAELLEQFPFSRTIDTVHMHHTWRPDHSQYRGLDSIVAMWRF